MGRYKKGMTILLVTLLCFAGCQEKQPDPVIPTPTATVTPVPTATMTPQATVTPTPMATNIPTSPATMTPVPTATVTPVPTATNTPTPTITLTPAATVAPTREAKTPFATVSPVPESEIAEIAGTMTVETYPVVDGSTAALPLSYAVFMAATGENAEAAAQNVKHTKTTNSYYRLYDKEADLLIVYEPSEAVVERMQSEPILIKPIGLDALVFMANTANAVESLTIEQLIAIYSGQVNNWADVGGADLALLAFQRPVGSGSQSLMQKLVMGDVEMTTGDNVFRYSTMSDILEGMLSYNGEDNTLGYSVFYYANNMYFEKDLKFMGVNGVLPSTQTIYDGTYPCVNAFYAAIRVDEPADSNARKLFDWLTGEAGQQLVLDLGYVPVTMPEGAEISDTKENQVTKREVLTTEPLSEGQYFVMLNPQNTESEFYYGDMTVYNSSWEEIANFYNVTLDYTVAGVHTLRYLPIGQIRQNAAGEQEVRYGIFDLEAGGYSIKPIYQDMHVLDAERGYYGVPQQADGEWMVFTPYQIIGPTGEVLLEDVVCDMESITMYRMGNGYLEMEYDYEHWENGCVYRFYDENLKPVNVFCEKAVKIPDDADRVEGVGYYLIGEYGCLIDENGEVLLTADAFLSRYGDGTDMRCILPFYMPMIAEEGEVYGIYYQGAVYVVDAELDLIAMVYDVLEYTFHGAEFYEDLYSYWDEGAGGTVYYRYDGTQIILQADGRMADEVVTNWENRSYLFYDREGTTLYMEEHPAGGVPVAFSVPLRFEDSVIEVQYDGDGYVSVSEASGETIQDAYSRYYREVPLFHKTLYYHGTKVCEDLALSYEYNYEMGEGTFVWCLNTGEVEQVESESIFEEMQAYYTYYNYAFVQNGELKAKIDKTRILFYGNDAILLVQGNYVYAVAADGEILVRALQNVMGTD